MKKIYPSLSLAHVMNAINADPVKKIRLLLEGGLAKVRMCRKKEEIRRILREIYLVANSLDNAIIKYENAFIPWSFSHTKENYEKFIKPWLVTFPDYYIENELDKYIKQEKLRGKEEYEAFFILTSKIGITELALKELKVQFSSYAMPYVLEALDEIVTIEIEKLGRILVFPSEMGEEE